MRLLLGNPTALRNRRGFALPLVILLTLVLMISIGAGLIVASVEHGVGTDHDAQLKAYAMAQEGVERYLTTVTSLPTTFPDTRTISLTGGTATVTLRQIRAAAGSFGAVYALTSVGDATSSNLKRSANVPTGERSISQFVTWQAGSLDADAAFTTLSTLNVKNGSSGTVSGNNLADATTSCPGGGTSIAGLAVPNSGLNMNGHSTDFIDGTPDNTPIYIGTPGPTGTAKDAVTVDWSGILSGSIAPDFVLDRTSGKNNGTWPTPHSSPTGPW